MSGNCSCALQVSKAVRIPEKHLDRALGRVLRVEKAEMYPQKYPRYPQLDARSRMAISDTDQDGRRRLLVYVRPDSLGGCMDDWLPGQCARGLVGLTCVRLSRAAVFVQIGRPGKPDACFAQPEAGWTVGRAARQRFGVEPSDPWYRLIEKCVELYSQFNPPPCMRC